MKRLRFVPPGEPETLKRLRFVLSGGPEASPASISIFSGSPEASKGLGRGCSYSNLYSFTV